MEYKCVIANKELIIKKWDEEIRKHNNSKINLEWNTMSENIIHSFKNGFHNSEKGEKRNNSKLTEKDVLEIRNIGRTKTLNLIAKDYGVSFQLISNIINRKCWRHI